MIDGIGVDIVTISRIAATHKRFGERFERRFLHPQEIKALQKHKRPINFLAKRFAAKEAAVKALGTGERGGVLLSDFYIVHNELGKPELKASGKAASVCKSKNISRMHVSLSDEKDQIVAFVVLESREPDQNTA